MIELTDGNTLFTCEQIAVLYQLITKYKLWYVYLLVMLTDEVGMIAVTVALVVVAMLMDEVGMTVVTVALVIVAMLLDEVGMTAVDEALVVDVLLLMLDKTLLLALYTKEVGQKNI